MGLSWRTIDPKTGRTVEELPGAHLRSDLCQIIGRGEPVTIELPWPDRFPERWRVALTPGRMVLICEDESTGRIWWGGLVTEQAYGNGPTLSVTAAAPENLLARTFVPSRTWTQVPQTQIMADLGLSWLATHLGGRVEIGASVYSRDRSYKDEDDKSRLDAMQDLMGVINGCEFTTWWESRGDGTVGVVAAAADRLGYRVTPDRGVEHEIYPEEWSLTRSYAAGKGAPIVRASTTPEGTEDGQAEKITAEARASDLLAAGWVPLEERFSPETGSKNVEIIKQYADGRLADLREGTVALEVKLLVEDFPAGIRLGDDISLILQNPDMPPNDSPNMVEYAPGLSMLVGSLTGLRQIDTGLWVDSWGQPVQIVADARILGWALSATDGEITHVTPVLDLKGIRW